jgi:hypothetical protein
MDKQGSLGMWYKDQNKQKKSVIQNKQKTMQVADKKT